MVIKLYYRKILQGIDHATFLADASVASHHYQNEVLTETAYRHYEYMYYELPFRRK